MLKLAICEDDVIQCEQIQCLTQSSLRIPFEFDIFSSAIIVKITFLALFLGMKSLRFYIYYQIW